MEFVIGVVIFWLIPLLRWTGDRQSEEPSGRMVGLLPRLDRRDRRGCAPGSFWGPHRGMTVSEIDAQHVLMPLQRAGLRSQRKRGAPARPRHRGRR
jgi:hypothetical protein